VPATRPPFYSQDQDFIGLGLIDAREDGKDGWGFHQDCERVMAIRENRNKEANGHLMGDRCGIESRQRGNLCLTSICYKLTRLSYFGF
jgi:hypothetical protein